MQNYLQVILVVLYYPQNGNIFGIQKKENIKKKKKSVTWSSRHGPVVNKSD